jgi:preprotein translocase SecE subunit
MANKTIDRKKAVPTRAQAAKASPKNASTKPARPSESSQGKPSDLKAEQSTSAGAEVLEVEEVETEELAVDEVDEADEEAVDEVDEEEVIEEDEEVVEEKPTKSRSAKPKKERDLMEVAPQDYSIRRASGSRLPNFWGSKFLYASYRELRLVTWPSRRDTWHWSLVVVGVSVGIALLLGVADFGLSKFVTWWLSFAH